MTFSGFLRLRCPVCERAKVFQGYLDTPDRCRACGFYFMRETGYFLPHTPIGYVFTVAVALAVWPLLQFGFGIRSGVVILPAMVTVAIVFGLWFVRYAKMIWLVFDLTMHPPSQEDFEARGRSSDQRTEPPPTTPSSGDDADA
jgi:uncharacterized protein (DUF983 family)